MTHIIRKDLPRSAGLLLTKRKETYPLPVPGAVTLANLLTCCTCSFWQYHLLTCKGGEMWLSYDQ